MSITFKRTPIHIGTTIAVSVPAHFIKEGFPTQCEWKVTIEPDGAIDSNENETQEDTNTKKSEHIEEMPPSPNIL